MGTCHSHLTAQGPGVLTLPLPVTAPTLSPRFSRLWSGGSDPTTLPLATAACMSLTPRFYSEKFQTHVNVEEVAR